MFRARLFNFGLGTAIGFGCAFAYDGGFYATHSYENKLESHPYVVQLLGQGYRVVSNHGSRARDYHSRQMVTTSLLSGVGKVKDEPITLKNDKGEEQTLYHLGTDLKAAVKHSWFGLKSDRVHKGIALLILDECLAHCAFSQLPRQLGVTAQLRARSIRDIPVDSYVVLHALPKAQDKPGSRKAEASGALYLLDGTNVSKKLVSGDIVIVEPRWASKFAWLLRWTFTAHHSDRCHLEVPE